MIEQVSLPTTTPEELGIPSESILQLIERLEKKRICMHSLLVIRNGRIAAEGYWKPFSRDRKHRMYSVTKSFVSVAVGLMIGEGRLSLDNHIVDFFPEKLPPEGVHPYIAAMTIQDMLMMASAHESTTYRRIEDEDWVRTFFVCPPSHLPGTIFSYDTSATTVLTALVEKLSGTDFLSYMRPRLLDPIGFSEDAWCIKTPMGESWGGSGLLCTSLDLAKFALTCMQKGRFGDKQLIPKDYILMATSRQVGIPSINGHPDMQQGYGYQFWRCQNNGFACRGMGSQLAICLPDENLILVTTADTQGIADGDLEIFDALWEELYPYLAEQPLPKNSTASQSLHAKLASLTVQTVPGNHTSSILQQIKRKSYQMTENDMGLLEVAFVFEDDTIQMEYINRQGKHLLRFGIGKNESQKFPIYDYACINSAAWSDEHSLVLTSYIIDDYLATLHIFVCFKEDTITLFMRKAAEKFLEEYSGFASGVGS